MKASITILTAALASLTSTVWAETPSGFEEALTTANLLKSTPGEHYGLNAGALEHGSIAQTGPTMDLRASVERLLGASGEEESAQTFAMRAAKSGEIASSGDATATETDNSASLRALRAIRLGELADRVSLMAVESQNPESARARREVRSDDLDSARPLR
jgi:hypothetical protein